MDCPLYHPSLLELLKVLRQGAFGNRYHLRHISMETALLLQQHLNDSHTYRVTQSLCKTSYLLLPCRQLFFVIHPIGISNYCSQNYELFFSAKQSPEFLQKRPRLSNVNLEDHVKFNNRAIIDVETIITIIIIW